MERATVSESSGAVRRRLTSASSRRAEALDLVDGIGAQLMRKCVRWTAGGKPEMVAQRTSGSYDLSNPPASDTRFPWLANLIPWTGAALFLIGAYVLLSRGYTTPLWESVPATQRLENEFNAMSVLVVPVSAVLLLLFSGLYWTIRRRVSGRSRQYGLVGATTFAGIVLPLGWLAAKGGMLGWWCVLMYALPAAVSGVHAAVTRRPRFAWISGIAMLALSIGLLLFVLGFVLVGGQTD